MLVCLYPLLNFPVFLKSSLPKYFFAGEQGDRSVIPRAFWSRVDGTGRAAGVGSLPEAWVEVYSIRVSVGGSTLCAIWISGYQFSLNGREARALVHLFSMKHWRRPKGKENRPKSPNSGYQVILLRSQETVFDSYCVLYILSCGGG